MQLKYEGSCYTALGLKLLLNKTYEKLRNSNWTVNEETFICQRYLYMRARVYIYIYIYVTYIFGDCVHQNILTSYCPVNFQLKT